MYANLCDQYSWWFFFKKDDGGESAQNWKDKLCQNKQQWMNKRMGRMLILIDIYYITLIIFRYNLKFCLLSATLLCSPTIQSGFLMLRTMGVPRIFYCRVRLLQINMYFNGIEKGLAGKMIDWILCRKVQNLSKIERYYWN